MKQHQSIRSKTSNEQTEMEQGLTVAPPQFKLSAAAIDGSSNLGGQKTSMEESLDSPTGGSFVERVSNFGRMKDEVVAACNKNDLGELMVALEAIKHDKAEWDQFKIYFQTKMGADFETFIASKFGADDVGPLLRNMDADMSKVSASNVAALIQESIGEDNPSAVMSLLIAYGDPKTIVTAYAAAYPGQDLRTDLQAMSDRAPALKTFLLNFFGDRQNHERVRVQNAEEAREARAIIARIYDNYGVDVNSQRVLEEVRTWSPDAPEAMVSGITTTSWTIAELRDLEFGLSKFAPIAGKNRQNSTRSSKEQEVQTAGRLNHRLEKDPHGNYRPTSTIGGTYSTRSKSFMVLNSDPSLKNSGKMQKNAQGKEVEVQDGSRMVITHELTHGFLDYALPEFVKRMSIWATGGKLPSTEWDTIELPDGSRKTAYRVKTTKEIPPTMYGLKSAQEDLADSVAMYINNPAAMKNGSAFYQEIVEFADPSKGQIVGAPCPERYAFISEKMAQWKQR